MSGSRDTNIVVWDIVSECGLYRLHGHKVKRGTIGTVISKKSCPLISSVLPIKNGQKLFDVAAKIISPTNQGKT